MKKLRTGFFILSACLMMVYNLSCANATSSMGSELNNDLAPVAEDTFERITVNQYSPDVQIKTKKIIVQPVARRVAGDE